MSTWYYFEVIKLSFQNYTNKKIGESLFQKMLSKAVSACKIGGNSGVITLTFIRDGEIKKINKKYRGKNKATDVLSFSYFDIKTPKLPDDLLGEVMISIDTAKAQANERGVTLAEELRTLFVHGLLHVFGYIHETDKEEENMEKMAQKILKKD